MTSNFWCWAEVFFSSQFSLLFSLIFHLGHIEKYHGKHLLRGLLIPLEATEARFSCIHISVLLHQLIMLYYQFRFSLQDV